MYVIYLLLGLFAVSLIFGIAEYLLHQKRIYSIPVRIHINGARGKSSVTRLVGAGLRAGGIKTITKVTGTYPRLILQDGKEAVIYRRGSANIIEQKSIVKYAVKEKAEALVIECMALQPEYQRITENKMIHATVGVITNIRPDHLDVMGPTLKDVALALGKTIPKNGVLFTSEYKMFDIMKEMADKRNTKLIYANPKSITKKDMDGFSYIEHEENVALALAISGHFGVDRRKALRGMYSAIPDEGVLRFYDIHTLGKHITFYNALAANDPQSSYMIWRKLQNDGALEGGKAIILNTRQDRLDRARQLIEMIASSLAEDIDFLFLTGQSLNVVEKMALQNGLSPHKIRKLDFDSPKNIFDNIVSTVNEKTVILAFGNMGSMGAVTAEYFKKESDMNKKAWINYDEKGQRQFFKN